MTAPGSAHPARLRRRSALTGAAGLVLGAAGATGAARYARDDPDAPRPPSPGEELMTEHGVLKRVLLCYRAVSDRLAAGRPVPMGAVLDAAQIVAGYVESFHEGMEEAYVFPRVTERHGDLVRTLLTQHDRGRHLTARVLQAAATLETAAHPHTDATTTLRHDLDLFVRMYEPHEAFEDTIIYPALRALTPQRVLDELADRFVSEEHGRYRDDQLAAILDRVTGVEQQLGLADLNAFTPPAP